MSKSNIKQKVLNRIWLHIQDLFHEQRVVDSTVVQNLNYSHSLHQKKAIISYRTDSFFSNWEVTSSGRTQPFEILSIVKVLADLGYCIDVIDCNDPRSLPALSGKRYDLIFGFGENFYQLTQQQPAAVSVLYMTEQHPEFSYQEEQKRIDYFNLRHNRQLKIARSGIFYKLHHLTPTYSHIIAMGEVEPFQKQYDHVFTIFPTGLRNPHYTCFRQKEHQYSSKHFLWLGTSGAAIHKGLDLLLDIFSKRNDIVLHIGGLKKSDRKIFSIPNRHNIIDHGFIDVKSELFLQLVEQCTFKLLPSCSEACATSVATGMLHGLIPVVMQDAGFNRLGSHAIFLNDFELAYLENQIITLANTNPTILERMSQKAFEFALSNFTIQAFEQSIYDIFNRIETQGKMAGPTKLRAKHSDTQLSF